MLPVLARLGPLTIGTHDFFTILGLLAGFALYYRALRRDRILGGPIALISVAAILGGALGARLSCWASPAANASCAGRR